MFLRRRAQEIVELADKTQSEFLSNEDIISGDIYIGGGETDAMRIVAKTAKELQKNYPGIRYHLYSGNAQDVTERLDKGLLDFGILIGSSNLNKYDYLKLPVTDTWGLLMKKDSPLMDKDVISSADLKDLPLIVSIQALKTNELSGWSGYSFEDLNIVATYNLVYNATLMVDEGLGYVLTLDKLVNTSGGSKFCFKPLKPKLEAPLYIVWKKYQVFSKATEKFIEALQDLL